MKIHVPTLKLDNSSDFYYFKYPVFTSVIFCNLQICKKMCGVVRCAVALRRACSLPPALLRSS